MQIIPIFAVCIIRVFLHYPVSEATSPINFILFWYNSIFSTTIPYFDSLILASQTEALHSQHRTHCIICIFMTIWLFISKNLVSFCEILVTLLALILVSDQSKRSHKIRDLRQKLPLGKIWSKFLRRIHMHINKKLYNKNVMHFCI